MKKSYYLYAAFGASLLILGSLLLAYTASKLPAKVVAPPTSLERPATGTTEETSSPDVPTSVTISEPDTQKPEAPASTAVCFTGGCSGEICGEAGDAEGRSTICIYRPEYACYKKTKCERQQNGKCGWTKTETFNACIENPPTE